MPIYEYRCEGCGAERELILRPGQDARPSCPGCRKRMKRVISPTSFILKGQGWYVTDYPSRERSTALAAEKGAPKEKDAGGKGEAAPKAAETAAPKAGPAKKPRGRKGA